MEVQILLAHIRALIERMPDFEQYVITSREHLIWLGQAHALISRWNSGEAISFKVLWDSFTMSPSNQSYFGQIIGILYRAIADLELKVSSSIENSFEGGNVYDFFRALNKVIESAEKSLLIIDPYLDPSIFDYYLNSRKNNVTVKLLADKYANDLSVIAQKYNEQFGDILEIRKSKLIHDRVIFIDNNICWIIGQSIKDAAKAKPTYLVSLSPDIVRAKLATYENIWENANSFFPIS